MKKILILSTLFLLTGCNITYNLEIDEDNNFTENFQVEAYATDTTTNTTEMLYNYYLEEYPIYIDEDFSYYDPYTKEEGYTYYHKSYKSLDNGYLFNYQAKFKYEDFNRARTLNESFNNKAIGYIKEDDYYYLSASSASLFKYNENLENITININCKNCEVIKNNASLVTNNVYTWNISKNSNTNINFQYRLTKKEEENNNSSSNPKPGNSTTSNNSSNEEENKKENSYLDYILVGAILLLFVIGILGLIKYMSVNKKE